MTIPRLPGPLDWLTNTAAAGFQAYDQERARKYDQALTGSRLIAGLIQAGQLDPTILSDPNVQSQFTAANIPVPPTSKIVPSVPAARARATVDRAQAAGPGSLEEQMIFQIPGLPSEISAEELKTYLGAIRQEAAKNPALGRLMAEVIPPDVAEGLERGQRAAITPKVYVDAAENFVAQAKGDAKAAKALAAADPQYQELVANGQLSDEYFARAARAYALLDEESRLNWARLQAQRQAMAREERMYYDQIIRAYDRDIGQMQADLKANALSTKDQIFVDLARQKQAAGQPLDQMEAEALAKFNKAQELNARMPSMIQERDDLRDRFILNRNPPIPNPRDPAARRSIRDSGSTLRGGGAAAGTAPESVPNRANLGRRAGESDADWWERLKKAGLSPAEATARVRGGR